MERLRWKDWAVYSPGGPGARRVGASHHWISHAGSGISTRSMSAIDEVLFSKPHSGVTMPSIRAGGAMKASAASEFSLEHRVALVTGGATGIGHATVRMLAGAGATVVLVDLPSQEPAARAEALHRAEGLDTHGSVCDVTSDQELRSLVDSVRDEHGRLDIAVANAGVALDVGPHQTTSDEELDAMFSLHVRSVLHLANLTLPFMADSGGGAFVVMSSIAGLRGNGLLGSYGVTKAANAQLVRNLAVQWAQHGIRVNAISPGVISTDFAVPITGDDAIAQRRLQRTPLGRFGRPEEVASAVLWLAGAGGAFVTGQNIVIDGGTLIAD